LDWVKHVFDPQTKPRANQKPRILICDGFGTHESLEVMEYCFENNIILCRIPSHTSYKLQPSDVGAFGPLKAAYREQVERLYRGGSNTVGKQHFTSLYSRAREQAITSRNIKSGWSKAGLYPFSPDKVLRDIQKPLPELCVPKVDEVNVESCLQGAVLQTLVTSEALTSLQSRIENDAHLLDGPSKHRLQKLANAAQKAFAERALLLDENRLLFEQNNESNRRQSTKSTVVGKAKVMSYEDIVEAQARRDAREAILVKGKRGPKRKSSTSVVMEAKRTRSSEVEVAEDKIKAMGLENHCSVLQF
jgi:hypothetical protein